MLNYFLNFILKAVFLIKLLYHDSYTKDNKTELSRNNDWWYLYVTKLNTVHFLLLDCYRESSRAYPDTYVGHSEPTGSQLMRTFLFPAFCIQQSLQLIEDLNERRKKEGLSLGIILWKWQKRNKWINA